MTKQKHSGAGALEYAGYALGVFALLATGFGICELSHAIKRRNRPHRQSGANRHELMEQVTTAPCPEPDNNDVAQCRVCFRSFGLLNSQDVCLKRLGCGHLFCEECINRLVESVNSSPLERARCPVCRREINLEEVGRTFV